MTGRKSGILQLTALLLVAALLTYWLQAQRPPGTNVKHIPQAQVVWKDRTSPAAEVTGADLTVVVFTDYRCPACRRAHPALKRSVLDDGKVRVVYKDWPVFGEMSEHAAEAAIASDFQGIYSEVHDRLMTGPVRNRDDIRAAVEASGGDWAQLQSDLHLRKLEIDDQLGRNRLQAFGLGLGGTPGYLIGPLLVRGALTQSEFENAFDEARNAS